MFRYIYMYTRMSMLYREHSKINKNVSIFMVCIISWKKKENRYNKGSLFFLKV